MRPTLCRLLAVAAFVASPSLAQAAAPAPVVPAKNDSPMDAARKAMDEVGDMKYENKSLNELIGDVKAKSKVAITIDPIVFQFGFDPNQPTINVNLKQVKLKDGLRQALAPFNLKCGLTREGLYISTEDGLTTKQLRQRVSVDCDGTQFSTAAKQLAADTGVNLVIDPRLGDKANKAVTLKLDDVPLETAVYLLAELADLAAVRMNNVLFVTTPEGAKRLKPHADGPTQPNNNGVIPFPGGPGGVPLPGVIGPPGGFGVVPAQPVEEKKAEPEKKEPEKQEPEKKP